MITKSKKNFNHIELFRLSSELKTFYEDSADDFLDKLSDKTLCSIESLRVHGDSISFSKNGTIRIYCNDYSISETAFYQILSYLELSQKFCSSITKESLIDNLNKMFSSQYDVVFALGTSFNYSPKMIMYFRPELNIKTPHIYKLFSNILQLDSMESRSTSFIAGVSEDFTFGMYLIFENNDRHVKQLDKKYTKSFIWPGVEILVSPTWAVLPSVTPCVFGEDYVVMDKSNSLKLDLKNTGMTRLQPIIETFIRNVKPHSLYMADVFERGLITQVTPSVNSFINTKLPKVIDSNNGKMTDYCGKYISSALTDISKSNTNSTLNQRRKVLFFSWEILELMENSSKL